MLKIKDFFSKLNKAVLKRESQKSVDKQLTGAIWRTVMSMVSIAILIGSTYAWYVSKSPFVDGDMSQTSSAEFGFNVGYEVYKYDTELNQGIGVNPDQAVMNLYDRIYPEQNKNASIILCAILSDEYATLVDGNGNVGLRLQCAYDGVDREPAAEDTDGIVDYLSNVVDVKAAYIPNIYDIAMAGTYNEIQSAIEYKSADDYLYRAASDYFDTQNTAVKFIESSFVPGVNESETEYTLMRITSVDAYKTAKAAEKTKDVNILPDGITEAVSYSYKYVLSDTANHILFLNNSSIGSATVALPNTGELTEDFVTGLNISGVSDQDDFMTKYGFTLTEGDTNTFLLENNGKKLNLSGTSLTAGDVSLYWTFANNGAGMTISSGNNKIRYNSNRFQTTTNNNNATRMVLTQIEKKKITRTRAASESAGTKYIDINVNLGEEFKSADGFYHMFIQIDYNPALINAYMLRNGIVSVVGEGVGTSFSDKFTISVVAN